MVGKRLMLQGLKKPFSGGHKDDFSYSAILQTTLTVIFLKAVT